MSQPLHMFTSNTGPLCCVLRMPMELLAVVVGSISTRHPSAHALIGRSANRGNSEERKCKPRVAAKGGCGQHLLKAPVWTCIKRQKRSANRGHQDGRKPW